LGIALPTWLIEAKNSPFVLGVYALAFGIGLPFFVVITSQSYQLLNKLLSN
jgi:preprotein translocase subunit Sec63